MILLALAACDAESDPRGSLEGLWIAAPEGLPGALVRDAVRSPEHSPVIARGLRFTQEAAGMRWCMLDVREGTPPERAATPCDCSSTARTDCTGGSARLDDAVVPGAVVELVLTQDGAAADLAGTLAWFPANDVDVLGLNVSSVQEPASLRPAAAYGLQGPLWSGADGLGWYRRQ